MKSNIIVIIACDRLCKNLCYLKQLEYKNGKKIDYIDLYACNADDKDAVAPFIETIIDKYEYAPALKESIKDFLNFFRSITIPPISEDLKLFIAQQMYQIKSDSWKYMTRLMSDNQYLVIPVDVKDKNLNLPNDFEDITFAFRMLALQPSRL